MVSSTPSLVGDQCARLLTGLQLGGVTELGECSGANQLCADLHFDDLSLDIELEPIR